jgi:hypothetical protein
MKQKIKKGECNIEFEIKEKGEGIKGNIKIKGNCDKLNLKDLNK